MDSFQERVICICDKSVQIDSVTGVSRYLDRWDKNSKHEIFYCKDCPKGKYECLTWLHVKVEEECEES